MNDEIMQEVWRNRDALAAKYNDDLDAIVAAIREREGHPLTEIVLPARREKREPSNAR